MPEYPWKLHQLSLLHRLERVSCCTWMKKGMLRAFSFPKQTTPNWKGKRINKITGIRKHLCHVTRVSSRLQGITFGKFWTFVILSTCQKKRISAWSTMRNVIEYTHWQFVETEQLLCSKLRRKLRFMNFLTRTKWSWIVYGQYLRNNCWLRLVCNLTSLISGYFQFSRQNLTTIKNQT